MIRPICRSRKPTDIEVNLRGRPPVGVVEPEGGCGGAFWTVKGGPIFFFRDGGTSQGPG
jgi:hypothetical protein